MMDMASKVVIKMMVLTWQRATWKCKTCRRLCPSVAAGDEEEGAKPGLAEGQGKGAKNVRQLRQGLQARQARRIFKCVRKLWVKLTE
jgi:hypothetical protein